MSIYFSRLDSPAMRRSGNVAIMAVFSALAVASNYAMIAFPQVKLMDSIVFVSAYLYGFGVGAGVAVITWIVYGSLNPLGAAGFPLILVLVVGELVFAASGALLSRGWKRSTVFTGSHRFLNKSLVLGVTGLLSAFVYDFWTNAIDGLLIYRSVEGIFYRWMTGAYFAFTHEAADFMFFAFVVPALIVAISRVTYLRPNVVSN